MAPWYEMPSKRPAQPGFHTDRQTVHMPGTERANPPATTPELPQNPLVAPTPERGGKKSGYPSKRRTSTGE